MEKCSRIEMLSREFCTYFVFWQRERKLSCVPFYLICVISAEFSTSFARQCDLLQILYHIHKHFSNHRIKYYAYTAKYLG